MQFLKCCNLIGTATIVKITQLMHNRVIKPLNSVACTAQSIIRVWLCETKWLLSWHVYLNCHMYAAFVVVFALVDGLSYVVAICLFICLGWLVITIVITIYLITSDNHEPCTKIDEAGGLPLGQSSGRSRWVPWAMCTYISMYFIVEVKICCTGHSVY